MTGLSALSRYSRDEGRHRVETYWIDFGELELYEPGALFLSVMLYPNPNEITARENLRRSLCASAIRQIYDADPVASEQVQSLRPIYALRDLKQINRDLGAYERRLKQRLTAAYVAIAFLKEEVEGAALLLPKNVKKVSINQLAEFIGPHAGESDPNNFGKRVWRPSLRVIHLAAAVEIHSNLWSRTGKQTAFGDLLFGPREIELIVETAREYEELLAKSRLKIDPASLIKFRLRKYGQNKIESVTAK